MKMKKKNRIYRMIFMFICGLFLLSISQVSNVQAASDKTMKAAYQKYVNAHKSDMKYYAYVNIGPNNKPVLLTANDPASSTVYGITSCKVYYYTNGKVKYLINFGGMHALSLKRYNGKYYISSGTSSNMKVANVYSNRLNIINYCNSKNKYFKTKKSVQQGSGYRYTEYILNYSNYRKKTAAYKNVKEINFSKIKSTPAKLNVTNLKMGIGATKQLKVTGGTSTVVRWSSSDKTVVTVGQNNGHIYAKKSGKATITAKVGGKKLTCKVTVVKIAPGAMKYLKGEWTSITFNVDGPSYTARIDEKNIVIKYKNGKTIKYKIYSIRKTSYGYFICFKTPDGTNGGYRYDVRQDTETKSLPLVSSWNPYDTWMSYASGLQR